MGEFPNSGRVHEAEDGAFYWVRDVWLYPQGSSEWHAHRGPGLLVRCEYATRGADNSVEWHPTYEGVAFADIKPFLPAPEHPERLKAREAA